MSAPTIICAYRAINATGWAIADSCGVTRPATEEEAGRYREVPSFDDMAAQNSLLKSKPARKAK